MLMVAGVVALGASAVRSESIARKPVRKKRKEDKKTMQ